jgi:tRNA dimethylallyltransferase
MDIGTAKPSKEEQKLIPHHMIDCAGIKEEYNVSLYVNSANRVISEILYRNKIPLIVGGTGLYVKALIDGLFEGPSGDEKIRSELEKKAREEGLPSLYSTLKEIDHVSSEKIMPNDKRRIIRALEVYYVTGKPISSFQKQWNKSLTSVLSPEGRGREEESSSEGRGRGEEPSPDGRGKGEGVREKNIIIGLNRERKDLYERINKRVEDMFNSGLVEEVKGLIRKGLLENKTARQALGYKEVIDFLDGKYSLLETKEIVKTNTRHFAKRQLTWFRKDDRVRWIAVQKEDNEDDIAYKIMEIAGKEWKKTINT